MRNILSFNSPLRGKEIKDWIRYHTENQTEYSRIAKKMHRFSNISDNDMYDVYSSSEGTSAGKAGRNPIVVRHVNDP